MELDDLLEIVKKIIEFPLFTVKRTPVTLTSVLIFTVVMTGFAVVSRLAGRLMTRWLKKLTYIEEGTRFILIRVIQYLIVITGGVISIQFVGLDLSGLAVIFGLLSVGIGFGMQNLVANFISGLILLFERPIKVGDRVFVDDIEGDVVEINIRSTTVRSIENISIIVPNSKFTAGNVVNWSHRDKRIRLPIDVGVSYGSDLDAVIKALREVGEENHDVLKNPKPEVMHQGFGNSAWNMRLWCWISHPSRHLKIESDLHCAIVHKFRERKIEIPFPQRDLHLRSSEPIVVNSTRSE